jgi:hypothetical protein
MAKTGVLTKILASVGTVLVWLPILAPILFSVAGLMRGGLFRLDYLMPAELFPVALAGGGLLVWAAFRARSRQRLISWGLGLAAGLLVGGQALAVVTGLASGETSPESAWLTVVFASLAIYTAAVVLMGVGGGLLLRDLFTPNSKPQ